MAAPRPLPLSELPSDIARLIERDGPHCVWCSRRLGLAYGDASREHVFPRSRGGKNTLANYLLACHPCNTRRRSQDPKAWARDCERRGLVVQHELVEQAIVRSRAGEGVKTSYLSRRERKERRRLRAAQEPSGA
jgi:hypothetical protein